MGTNHWTRARQMYTNRVRNRALRQGRLLLKSLPCEGQGLSVDTACYQDNQRANQTASSVKQKDKWPATAAVWHRFLERCYSHIRLVMKPSFLHRHYFNASPGTLPMQSLFKKVVNNNILHFKNSFWQAQWKRSLELREMLTKNVRFTQYWKFFCTILPNICVMFIFKSLLAQYFVPLA